MTRGIRIALVASAFSLFGTAKAFAWHVEGRVVCEGGLPLAGVPVTVQGTSASGWSYSSTQPTNAAGYYANGLPDEPGEYDVIPDLSAVGGGTVIAPGAIAHIVVTAEAPYATVNFLTSGAACQQLGCWLTGGGAKFSSISGGYVAEHGPAQNFGGNVNPSCSPEPGQGGQWNHIDHNARLHFQGLAIAVDRCGNVDGIPPGSTSPVTPYNFIEFHGTGTLKGIKGNRVDYGTVCFQGRAEDRNEPGSAEEKLGAMTDRYFLRVTNCAGLTLLLLEDVAAPGDSDPVTITNGNLQIHVSSCTSP